MRRLCLIFLGLLAIFMAGCSKVVEHEQTAGPRYEWMTDLSLPVPLMFGAEAVSSKAAIETLDDMVGKDFAFIAINKNAAALTDAMDLDLPDGTRARGSKGADGNIHLDFIDNNGTTVPYYYPMAPDSDDNYSFYAYHSSVLGVAERSETSVVVKDIPVAVQDDILWGAAEASAYTDWYTGVKYEGFNARYIRKAGINPLMMFEHPASCLSFKITRKNSSKNSDPQYSSIVVSAVNVPTKATLCLTDRSNQALSGTFISTAEPRTIKVGEIGAIAQDETLDLPDFFIAPQKDPIKLQLDMTLSDGTTSEVIYKIDPKTHNLANGFEKGTRYTFNLIVYSAVEIKIEVSVEAYEDAFDEEIIYNPDDIVQITP